MSRLASKRAGVGDEEFFRALVAAHSRELHLHCYRMLGSMSDAEDLLQETLTAAWRGLDSFESRSSLRAWLYSIATNRCLNAIRDGRRRPPVEPVPPFEPPMPSRRGDVTWLQPYPDAWLEQVPDGAVGPAGRYESREAVALAFVAALQRLPPRQTAALLLCDVLGFSSREAAVTLETNPTSVKGLLQRARSALDRQGDAPGRRSSSGAGSAGDERLARCFADALSADDIEGVLALLTDDAWLAMPPAPHEYHGSEAIGAFLRASTAGRGGRALRLVPTGANRQPAFACQFVGPDPATVAPAGILVLSVSGERIESVTRFLDAGVSDRFGFG